MLSGFAAVSEWISRTKTPFLFLMIVESREKTKGVFGSFEGKRDREKRKGVEKDG